MDTKTTHTARAELTDAVRRRYGAATGAEKRKILDEFIAVTGYHEKSELGSDQGPVTASMTQRVTKLREAIRGARLVALLESHRIEWRQPPASLPAALEPSRLSTGQKVALFRRLFRGRTDVYPTRWESKTTGKSGYAPACANEWRAGVCEKPRI